MAGDENDIRIETEDHGTHGRYVIRIPGAAEDAEMTWQRRDAGTLVFDHTYVPPDLRSLGLARKLVERGIADARAGGQKIVPACSYVAVQFRRHKDWADLLAAPAQ